jgi:hypothetical protein
MSLELDLKASPIIKAKHLSITEDRIIYGSQSLNLSNVKALKYGPQETYVNGIRVKRGFIINLTDEHETIHINFQYTYLPLAKKNEDAEKAYLQILDAIWPTEKRIASNFIEMLNSGKPIEIKNIQITPKGVNLKIRKLKNFFMKKEYFIPWTDARFVSKEGFLTLYSAKDRSIKTRVALLGAWNVGVLLTLLEYIWKDGRAFRLDRGEKVDLLI